MRNYTQMNDTRDQEDREKKWLCSRGDRTEEDVFTGQGGRRFILMRDGINKMDVRYYLDPEEDEKA